MNDEHWKTIIATRQTGYLVIRLDRPEALNALNHELMTELAACVRKADADPAVGCIIITGSERAFAAGADVREMVKKTYPQMLEGDYLADEWKALSDCRTPLVAGVAGYALGGGCELALLCDMIIAADTAKFGQPEITLAVAPGGGGTQRLTRAIGKAKAMDLILTGRTIDALEAERCGLISRLVPVGQLMDECYAVATQIATQSSLATRLNKELVNAAFESTLSQGLAFERRVFQSMFALADRQEGMTAFLEKRRPVFARDSEESAG